MMGRDSLAHKGVSCLLSVVLVAMLALPCSAFVKPQKAEAVAPVVVGGAVVLGTALAAYGVYAAGTTASQYEVNLNALYAEIENAASAAGKNLEDMLNGAVTAAGNIDLGKMAKEGFFGLLPSVVAGMLESGSAITGESSLAASPSVMYVNGVEVPTASMSMEEVIAAFNAAGKDNFAQTYASYTLLAKRVTDTETYYKFTNAVGPYQISTTKSSAHNSVWVSSTKSTDSTGTYVTNSSNGSGYMPLIEGDMVYVNSGLSWVPRNSSDTITSGYAEPTRTAVVTGDVAASTAAEPTGVVQPYSPTAEQLSSGYTSADVLEALEEGNATAGDTNKAVGDILSILTGGAIGTALSTIVSSLTDYNYKNGIFSIQFDGWRQLFSTLGTISGSLGTGLGTAVGGIASNVGSLVTSIPSNLGSVLNDIKTGVGSVETAIGTAVGGIASDVGSLVTSIPSNLGAVLNDIKTGVGSVETAVGTAVGGIVDGIGTSLGDIWGDLSGRWDSLLQWLGTTPLAKLLADIIAAINAGVLSLTQALDLAGVISAVQSAVADLATTFEGAIEGVKDLMRGDGSGTGEGSGEIEPFKLPPGPGAVDGTAKVGAFEGIMKDKAPFAYMFAFTDGMATASGYSTAPKFHLQHEFELLGQPLEIDVNAEPWLNRDIGGVTIAQLLRSSVTLTLCMGLLVAAYRTAMAAVGSRGD